MSASLVGSEMCIRDSTHPRSRSLAGPGPERNGPGPARLVGRGPSQGEQFPPDAGPRCPDSCVELPGNAESDHPVPAPGQPGGAATLVAAVRPPGQSLEPLHGGRQ
eukprot:8226614-Alexandrium_andersonii.AAC.1